MASQQRGPRGAYAKGIAKREEILTAALAVVAREGFRGASVKELADAVGLSQAGLLHYFGSKEELFAEILRKRDEVDSVAFGAIDTDPAHTTFDDIRRGFIGITRHNADVPGLVELYARVSVDAADPDHPAHDFFVRRGEQLRSHFAGAIERAQQEGRLTSGIAPETLARVLQAVADGLQVQWMLEPDLDMAATVEALIAVLEAGDSHG